MVHLDYRDARPIYMQIAEGLRSQIAAGILQQGDKLPSVRELAAELAINPNTIQRAYRELEIQGHIATVSGKGCFVCGMQISVQTEHQPLWDALDETVARLLELGISKEALIQRIRQGGDTNA